MMGQSWFEVTIPPAPGATETVKVTVKARNWHSALRAALSIAGERPEVAAKATCDVGEDKTLRVTEPKSGRVFLLREVEGAREDEGALSPSREPRPVTIPGAFRAPTVSPVPPSSSEALATVLAPRVHGAGTVDLHTDDDAIEARVEPRRVEPLKRDARPKHTVAAPHDDDVPSVDDDDVERVGPARAAQLPLVDRRRGAERRSGKGGRKPERRQNERRSNRADVATSSYQDLGSKVQALESAADTIRIPNQAFAGTFQPLKEQPPDEEDDDDTSDEPPRALERARSNEGSARPLARGGQVFAPIGAMPSLDVQHIWFEVARAKEWRTLAIVSAEATTDTLGVAHNMALMAALDPQSRVLLVNATPKAQRADVAARLMELDPGSPGNVKRHLDGNYDVIDVRELGANDHEVALIYTPQLLDYIGSADNEHYTTVVLALGSLLTQATSIPIARSADRVILCVSLERTSFAAAARSVEIVGRERVVGAIALKPQAAKRR